MENVTAPAAPAESTTTDTSDAPRDFRSMLKRHSLDAPKIPAPANNLETDEPKEPTDVKEALKQATEPKEEPKEEEKESPLMEKKVKVKVDGVEKEMSVKDLIARAQKGEGAENRMKEAAEYKKKMTTLLTQIRDNPMEALKHPAFGISEEKRRQMLEDELYQFIEAETLDPKEKELRELRKKLKVTEEKEKQDEQLAHEKQISEMAAGYQADYEQDIMSAIDLSGLPKSSATIKLVAKYLKMALNNGHKNVKASQVMSLVREEFNGMLQDMYGNADGDKLIDLFGKEFAEKIRKAELSKMKQGGKSEVKPSTGSSKKPMSFTDFKNANRARQRS